MARAIMCGFEIAPNNALNGFGDTSFVSGSTRTMDTSVFRSGLASLKCDSGAGNAASQATLSEISAPFNASTDSYGRFAFYVTSNLPTTTATIFTTGGSASGLGFKLTTGGKIQAFNLSGSVQLGSDSNVTIAVDTWYVLEFQVTLDSNIFATSLIVKIDDVEEITATGISVTSVGDFGVGWVSAPGANRIINFDDCAVNTSSGSDNNSWCGSSGKIVLLRPISDNQRGSWTGGSGGTTNLWDALNNTPPIGTATESNTTQIESVDSSGDNTTDEYRANLTPYSTFIPCCSRIVAIHSQIHHGEDVGTGSKTGKFGFVSNPADASGGGTTSFTYGADQGALGTYGTNWTGTAGVLHQNPIIALDTSPVLAVRKTDTGTRVASVCFMGAYVEYVPLPAYVHTPIQIAY
jgi:hypothetical protein